MATSENEWRVPQALTRLFAARASCTMDWQCASDCGAYIRSTVSDCVARKLLQRALGLNGAAPGNGGAGGAAAAASASAASGGCVSASAGATPERPRAISSTATGSAAESA